MLTTDCPRNHEPKYLGCPFPDLQKALIPIKTLHIVILEQTVSPMDLNGFISHLPGDLTAIQFADGASFRKGRLFSHSQQALYKRFLASSIFNSISASLKAMACCLQMGRPNWIRPFLNSSSILLMTRPVPEWKVSVPDYFLVRGHRQ